MGKNISESYNLDTELIEDLQTCVYIKGCSTLHHDGVSGMEVNLPRASLYMMMKRKIFALARIQIPVIHSWPLLNKMGDIQEILAFTGSGFH
jgi:hypothetical protein